MDEKLKRAWVKALRSGEYKQGKGMLCVLDVSGEPTYCCLGVLADIALDGWWSEETDSGCQRLIYGDASYASFLPPDFAERLGLTDGSPPCTKQEILAGMNDDSCHDFDSIADWIEENL